MATAKKLSNETGKTLKKAGKVAGAVAKGAGEGVKMAGNAAKVAHKVATEEVEVDEKVVYGGTPAKKEKPKMLVTRADKLGGTRAYKNMTAGDKRYKAADHLTSQVETGEGDMRLRLRERLKAAYEVTSPYIVDEGYRVVSKSYKHGDGKPEDDVTIKREKKVVSGDNLTRKGANQSKERRGREYGNQDAFAVQKTREAKKRPSNAPSVDKVKADINKKEKQREKTSYNRKIGGMNRAGTASGKVAAARLKGMKKIDAMEEVAIENVQGGPILPGEKGKKVYPKKDQPKKTGAKLPKINPLTSVHAMQKKLVKTSRLAIHLKGVELELANLLLIKYLVNCVRPVV